MAEKKLSPEEHTKHLNAITRLVELGAPADGQQGQGTLAVAFANWQEQQKVAIRNGDLREEDKKNILPEDLALIQSANFAFNPLNSKHQSILNGIVKGRLVGEKKRVVEVYMNGVTKTPSQADPASGTMLKEGLDLVGFGEGWMGWLANMVAKIPVVGELILAGFKVLTSGIGSLLSSVGLGEPGQKMVTFTEALQQTRDNQNYANGATALGGLQYIKESNAGILADLQAGLGNGPVPLTIKGRIGSDGDGNLGADQQNVVKFLDTVDKDKKLNPVGAKLRAYLADPKNPKLPPAEKFILVNLSDGTVGLAGGTLNKDPGAEGSVMNVKNIYRIQKDAAGVEQMAIIKVPEGTKLATGKIQPPPSTAVVLSTSKAVSQTLSETRDIRGLRKLLWTHRDNKVQVPDTNPALQQALVALDAKLAEGINVDDAANLKSVLVTLPGGKPAIATGTFDPYTNKLLPLYLTTAEGTKKVDGKPAEILVPLDYTHAKIVVGHLMPAATDPKAPTGPVKPDPKAMEKFIASMNGKIPNNIIGALQTAIVADEDMLLVQKSKEPGYGSVVAALPGGAYVIITGKTDGTTINPEFETRIDKNGILQQPEVLTGDRKKPVPITPVVTVPFRAETGSDRGGKPVTLLTDAQKTPLISLIPPGCMAFPVANPTGDPHRDAPPPVPGKPPERTTGK